MKSKISILIFISSLIFLSLALNCFAEMEQSSNPKTQEEMDEKKEDEISEEEKEALIKEKEKELKVTELNILKFKAKKDYFGSKTETLEGMIQRLNKDIEETEIMIYNASRELVRTEKLIQKKDIEISKQTENLNHKKKLLGNYLNILNRKRKRPLFEVLLNNGLAEYFRELNSINETTKKMKEIFLEVKHAKNELESQKENILVSKEKQLSLIKFQEEQKYDLENKRKHKDELLEKTQGEEGKFQELLNDEENLAFRLRTELTALQSHGKVIEFSDALNAARYASNLTGVRTSYLLGVLRVESNMGNNVGGGNYKDDMHPYQRPFFEEICVKLGYNPEIMPVSRKPCYRDSEGNCSGWGGAMGPAQFMPTTWNGYKDKVIEVTGDPAADPWNIKHALTAMALKVAKVDGVTSGDRKAEHKAANIYLAGGNWENFTWYGDKVMAYADAFEEKIKEENL